MWRSFQSVIGSCVGIHLVLMKDISNRSPLSAYWLFQCLQIEWDSLLWKCILGFPSGAFGDDRKESVCLCRVYSMVWMYMQPNLSLFCQTGMVSHGRVSAYTGHTTHTYWTSILDYYLLFCCNINILSSYSPVRFVSHELQIILFTMMYFNLSSTIPQQGSPVKREKWSSTITSTKMCIFKRGCLSYSMSKWPEKWMSRKGRTNTTAAKLTLPNLILVALSVNSCLLGVLISCPWRKLV